MLSKPIHKNNVVVAYGSKIVTLVPDSTQYNMIKQILGFDDSIKKIKYALTDKIMKFNAASFWGDDKDSNCYLLDNQYKYSAYIAKQNTLNQWVEVSSEKLIKVTGLILQGRFTSEQWIKKYRLSYSNDGNIYHSLFGAKQFEGSKDRNTKVKHIFQTPIQVKSIKFHPLQWNGHISFRIDFLVQEQ